MRSVFVATGAFLGRIDSETRCAFWCDEPVDHAFDPARLIVVYLAMTPHAALAGRIPWDAIEVDDCFTGPGGHVTGTTLGPRWPELHVVGSALLEQSFIRRLPPALRPPCPPKNMRGRPYEYTTSLYWPHINDPRAGNRYAGHHAAILEERGSLARVSVFPPGMSDMPERAQAVWLDLAAADQCDAGPDCLTEIGLGDRPKVGALFLINGRIGESDE
jgi:hypothetical protein